MTGIHFTQEKSQSHGLPFAAIFADKPQADWERSNIIRRFGRDLAKSSYNFYSG